MKVDPDKGFNKDVFYTIETASGYQTKSAWNKFIYVNFYKFPKIQKKDDFEQVVLPYYIKRK